MTTVLAFLFALGVLVAVHEYGHYRVAVACGVKVLRFSIGFGPVLWRRQPRVNGTEFTVSAIPLGGYVKMLDEREAPVPEDQRHRAFNTQPLRARVAIVAAGPLANLLLAIVLYSVVAWTGVSEPVAVLAQPAVGSLSAEAGIKAGDKVLTAGVDADSMQTVQSFDELRWLVIKAALGGDNLVLEVQAPAGGSVRQVELNLASLHAAEVDNATLHRIGMLSPYIPAEVASVVPGSAADKAGLKAGDRVLSVDQRPIVDWVQLVELIRASGQRGEPGAQQWLVDRAGVNQLLSITPVRRAEGDKFVWQVGVVGQRPAMTLVRRGPLAGVAHGLERTWDMASLGLQMLGRMLTGRASVKNLSGPLTMADMAGKTASLGLQEYLNFLAYISVSLGILNLLPVPILDGGHLMYYLWEGVKGKPLSEVWMDRLQRGGLAVLVLMMLVALFNDVTRRLG